MKPSGPDRTPEIVTNISLKSLTEKHFINPTINTSPITIKNAHTYNLAIYVLVDSLGLEVTLLSTAVFSDCKSLASEASGSQCSII